MMFNPTELKIRRRAWLQAAHIPPNRQGWELEDCKDVAEEDRTVIRKYLDAIQKRAIIRAAGQPHCGKGLLMYGTPGQGKTTLALVALQTAMRTFSYEDFDCDTGVLIRPCYFTTYNDILNLKGLLMDESADENQQVLYEGLLGNCQNDAYNVRLLVIDDVGREHAGQTGWQKNLLHHVLRTRFNNGLPTIITTNLPAEDWAGLYGDATSSFIKEAFSYWPVRSIRGDLRK